MVKVRAEVRVPLSRVGVGEIHGFPLTPDKVCVGHCTIFMISLGFSPSVLLICNHIILHEMNED